MPLPSIIQVFVYCGLLIALTPLLGGFMARVYDGRSRRLSLIERPIYRICGINPEVEQDWKTYTIAMLVFNLIGFVLLFVILRYQALFPLNPQHLPNITTDLAFNTAVSFVSNTNWQAYSGEVSLSYFSQMMGLSVQNFVSAATGMGLAIALIRALVRKPEEGTGLGNFYVDLVRGTLYILIPLSILGAVILAWQGVPQNLSSYTLVHTLESVDQTIAQGPMASQISIKQLGTNGGGFLGVNSAHPFEDPTPLANFLELLYILLIPAALTYTYGVMVKDRRQGWTLFAAMGIIFLVGCIITIYGEVKGNPLLTQYHVDQVASIVPGHEQGGGNMEGKDVRHGVVSSALWSVATTDASNGSVNAMHDSFMPWGGTVQIFNIMLGEVIFGGVGSGLYGILIYCLLTVFLCGLMVGRTPEFLGKKIEGKEMKYSILAIVVLPIGIVGFAAISLWLGTAQSSMLNPGAHGLSEVLYAYTSATGNNGSAFGGFTANTPYHNYMLGLAMLIGRFLVIVPMMVIAGSLAVKKILPPSSGTFPTHGVQFTLLLIGVLIIVGGLTYFPVLALGPIADALSISAVLK